MKRIALLLILTLTACAATDVCLFHWQEARDKKSGEKLFGFFLAPEAVRRVLEAEAKGDAKAAETLARGLPEGAWNYGLVLKGELNAYSKESIALFEPSPCGSLLTLFSGSVDVDRQAGIVRVALKVTQDGKIIDFVGNGVYHFKMEPNQSPQPTKGG